MLLLFFGPTRLGDTDVRGNNVAAAYSEHLNYLGGNASESNNAADAVIFAMRAQIKFMLQTGL